MAYSLYKEIEYALDGIPDANLTDFPKRFKIVADAEIAAECSGSGGFKVTSADGSTDLPIEVLASGTALASGNVEFWVKLSLLTAASVGDVVARIYYDGAETTVEDHAGVWSNDYVAVLHLEQDPSGSAPQMYDSVSESFIGTSAGSMTSGDLVAGQVGNGLDFDGSDDAVSTSYAGALNDFTCEAIFKTTGSPGSAQRIADKDFANGFWLGRSPFDSDQFGGGVRETTGTFGRYVVLNPGDWHQIVSRRSSTTHTIYGDGGAVSTSGTVSSSATNTAALVIAGTGSGDRLAVIIGELRISSVARDNDWLAYQYIDDFDNADTFTLSAELGGGGGDPVVGNRIPFRAGMLAMSGGIA